jgi:hypothetical protein
MAVPTDKAHTASGDKNGRNPAGFISGLLRLSITSLKKFPHVGIHNILLNLIMLPQLSTVNNNVTAEVIEHFNQVYAIIM